MTQKWIARILLAGVGLGVVYGLLSHVEWDRRILEEWLRAAGPAAPLLGVGMMLLQTLVSPIPFAVVVMALGAVFGPWWGALVSWLGALLGATLAYWLASAGLTTNLPKVRKLGFLPLLGIRLAPGVSVDLVSYGCGAAHVPFPVFLLSTALGLIPRTLTFSLFGNELWDNPRQALLLMAILLPLFGLAGYVIFRYTKLTRVIDADGSQV